MTPLIKYIIDCFPQLHSPEAAAVILLMYQVNLYHCTEKHMWICLHIVAVVFISLGGGGWAIPGSAQAYSQISSCGLLPAVFNGPYSGGDQTQDLSIQNMYSNP